MTVGPHFVFCRDYVTSGMLTLHESVFIQNLVDIAANENTEICNVDGKQFFLCTVKCLKASLSYNKSAQIRLLNALTKKGLLLTKHIGLPPKRWVWIDCDKLWNILKEAKRSRKGKRKKGGA